MSPPVPSTISVGPVGFAVAAGEAGAAATGAGGTAGRAFFSAGAPALPPPAGESTSRFW